MERWQKGFATQSEAFDWVLTSPYVHAVELGRARKGPKFADRLMYQAFFPYARDKIVQGELKPHKSGLSLVKADVLDAALEFFNKKNDFEEETRRRAHDYALTQVFTSTKVRQWTGLDQGAHWRTIKELMRCAREELGGEEGMLTLEEEAIRTTVLRLLPGVQAEFTQHQAQSAQ